MTSHYVRGKVKSQTPNLDRRAVLALGTGGLAAALLCRAAPARAAAINAPGGLAVQGYDVVAYFSDNAAVKGSAEFTAEHDGATWRFASAANRDAFLANPARYAPKYGGYCAYAVANGYTAKIDPQAFSVVDGALYLNFSKGVRSRWERDIPGNIARGDANWPALAKK